MRGHPPAESALFSKIGKRTRMAVVGEILFYRRNGVDLDAVIRDKTNGLRNVVDALPERVFSQQTDEQIAEGIAKSERIEPLELDFGAAVPKVEETQIERRGDDYGFRQGPVRIPALRATKTIPFAAAHAPQRADVETGGITKAVGDNPSR